MASCINFDTDLFFYVKYKERESALPVIFLCVFLMESLIISWGWEKLIKQ